MVSTFCAFCVSCLEELSFQHPYVLWIVLLLITILILRQVPCIRQLHFVTTRNCTSELGSCDSFKVSHVCLSSLIASKHINGGWCAEIIIDILFQLCGHEAKQCGNFDIEIFLLHFWKITLNTSKMSMAAVWNLAGLMAPVWILASLLFSGNWQDPLTKMNTCSLRILCVISYVINKYLNAKICMYVK